LPLSSREANRIFELCRSQRCLKALGFDANRALATSLQMSGYRYVHFATHALTDDDHPELSGIVLSLVDRAGVEQNGFLRVQDLYGLRLRADLVVLSACDTAVGKQVSGEGLLSVARGFFYAGAARVMATLWRVDDTATATFMALFYEALLGEAHPSPAAALRAAQTAMRAQQRWSDPYYWSGFVLQGAS
jgi:CHAT domain-containing protein